MVFLSCFQPAQGNSCASLSQQTYIKRGENFPVEACDFPPVIHNGARPVFGKHGIDFLLISQTVPFQPDTIKFLPARLKFTACQMEFHPRQLQFDPCQSVFYPFQSTFYPWQLTFDPCQSTFLPCQSTFCRANPNSAVPINILPCQSTFCRANQKWGPFSLGFWCLSRLYARQFYRGG